MLQKSRLGVFPTDGVGGTGSGGAGEVSCGAMLNAWWPALADELVDTPVDGKDGRGFPQCLQKIASMT